MENATSNGDDLLSELQIQFNKQRQAKITQELSEISAGSEALK
jgi:F-type H+-transporting ATPase subunit gamma